MGLRRINYAIQHFILSIINFIYKPFARFIPAQLFRYGVSGSANLVLDWVLFFIFYNFVFKKEVVHIWFLAFTPYIASFFVSFLITFVTGFWLSRYIRFNESKLQKGVQLYRYLMVVVICILMNYFGLKLFVEVFHIYPTPSKMIITVFTTLFRDRKSVV